MVDPHDEFDPGTPEPLSEPSPAPAPAPAPSPSPAPAPERGAGSLNFDAPSRTSPRAADVAPQSSGVPLALGTLLLSALVALGASWAYHTKLRQFVEPAGTATPPATAARPAGDKAGAKAGTKALRSEVEGLRADLKALQARVESLPQPAPAPDLGPLNTKIDELSGAIKPLGDLSKKMGDLDHHLAAVDEALTSVRGEVDTLEGEIMKRGESRPAASLPEEKPQPVTNQPEDVNVADDAMDQGVELFQAGKYQEASDVFQKLTETNPKDARVWYYAALSRGQATKDWKGETTRLVEKGVEREKAGSPESAKIDAIFHDLNPAFKPWLDAYRKRAQSR